MGVVDSVGHQVVFGFKELKVLQLVLFEGAVLQIIIQWLQMNDVMVSFIPVFD